MIVLDTRIAQSEIDRRLRAVDHHRRARWGQPRPTSPDAPGRRRGRRLLERVG